MPVAPTPSLVGEPDAAPPETETEPRPRRERPRWVSRVPWPRGRTRNAAPLDDALVIDNRTFAAWSVDVGFHRLGVVAAQARLTERVVKTGLLAVRPLDAPTGTAYLTAQLRPGVRAVEIHGHVADNQPVYELRLVEAGRAR
jgi:hypothetical protein